MKRWIGIYILVSIACFAYARTYSDTAVYQGIQVKLDVLNSILEPARTHGLMQTYEAAMNVRLKNRFYPTLELGYSGGKATIEPTTYNGHGGFVRLGMDLNAMKKNQHLPHALLVGLRIATAYQQYDLTQVKMNDTFWGEMPYKDFTNLARCDVWGEVVAGCHVNIVSGLMMGWYIRLKLLITRTDKNNGPLPYYIPGFGYRDDTNWGLNYYIGWKF